MHVEADSRSIAEIPSGELAGERKFVAPKWRAFKAWRLPVFRAVVVLLTSYILTVAAIEGWNLWRWIFEVTMPIRFGDIHRGCYWGLRASSPEGLLNQYEKMQEENSHWGDWLDYAPLRTLVMKRWGIWIRQHAAVATAGASDKKITVTPLDQECLRALNMLTRNAERAWQPSYEFNAPVLRFNAAMEGVGVICGFLLTWLWVARAQRPPPDRISIMAKVRKLLRLKPKPADLRSLAIWAAPPVNLSIVQWILLAIAGAGLLFHSIAYFGTRSWSGWVTLGIPLLCLVFVLAANARAGAIRGWGAGTVAALLLWFNAGILISAHGWPTWDMWIVPMYLLAVLLASLDWWFVAGLVVAAGAMFKGQQLTVAPVFVLWPLVAGRPTAALRWVSGVVLGIGLIASPWLLSYLQPDLLAAARDVQHSMSENPWDADPGLTLFQIPRFVDKPALIWVIAVMLATLAAPLVVRAWKPLARWKQPEMTWWRQVPHSPWLWRGLAAIFVLVVIAWPVFAKANREYLGHGIEVAVVFAIVAILVRPRHIGYVASAAVGTALLSCIIFYHGSTSWWDCGIHYGTIHWRWMVMGQTSNLPGILATHFDWPFRGLDETCFTIAAKTFFHHWPADDTIITNQQCLNGIYAVTLLLSGIGIGMHARRRDPRVLVAFTTPWLMFFLFPTQIHERYLLYAGGVAAICAGSSVGMTLMGIFLSIVTWIMTMHVMLGRDPLGFGTKLALQFPDWFTPQSGEKLMRFIQGTHPDIGYALLMCGAVFLYLTLAPRRRWKKAICVS